jgi:hypothetical protein
MAWNPAAPYGQNSSYQAGMQQSHVFAPRTGEAWQPQVSSWQHPAGMPETYGPMRGASSVPMPGQPRTDMNAVNRQAIFDRAMHVGVPTTDASLNNPFNAASWAPTLFDVPSAPCLFPGGNGPPQHPAPPVCLHLVLHLLTRGLEHNYLHDTCVFYIIHDGRLVVILSLHVDDTLVAGEKAFMNKLHADLETRFGKLKREENKFRHFGVDMTRSMTDFSATLDQTSYLANLKPMTVDSKGRLIDDPANPAETSGFRSLVSGVAWAGITSPIAQAMASMMQGGLPVPTIRQLKMLNLALAQLLKHYVPLVFKFGFSLPKSKLLIFSDSSLGNSGGKYSQGGYLIFLCTDDPNDLCSHLMLTCHRSAKSKRVANSTLAAELLANVVAIEEGTFLQTFLHELQFPSESAIDCNDLFDLLIKPGDPNLSNKSFMLHLSVVRTCREEKRVRAWIWIDTRDMLANPLTKQNADGSLDISDLCIALRDCFGILSLFSSMKALFALATS